MERKRMKRLMDTRFYDDFHPHKYFFKPENEAWDYKPFGEDREAAFDRERSQILTAPVGNPSRVRYENIPLMGAKAVELNAEAHSPLRAEETSGAGFGFNVY